VSNPAALGSWAMPLMMHAPPPFSWHHLNLWHVNWWPCLLLIVGQVLYFGLARREVWPKIRYACWTGGLVVTFLATQSVIGFYDMAMFSDHMIQHLLLIMVAAPLLAYAAPLDLLRHRGPEWLRRGLDSAPATALLSPLAAFIIYAAVIPATHLTSFFNVMLNNEWVHHSEQILFLLVGYLFFRQAFAIEEDCTLNPGVRLLYVMVAVPVDTITGLALNMTNFNPFPSYNVMESRRVIMDSIHLGGSIMWIGGDALMLLACIPVAAYWVREETRRTKILDAQLDAQGL